MSTSQVCWVTDQVNPCRLPHRVVLPSSYNLTSVNAAVKQVAVFPDTATLLLSDCLVSRIAETENYREGAYYTLTVID